VGRENARGEPPTPDHEAAELIERALLNSSEADDIVADLFGSSGSTLIACERRNRKARLMELDPKYADCIVQRWQEYAGRTATLDTDGQLSSGARSGEYTEPRSGRA
jgi:DNA modification methylase